MRKFSRRALLLATASAAAVLAGAELDPALASPPAGRRIALSGHDPVSYFVDGGPQKGIEAHWFAFDDAVYLFRSAEHRAMFAADPERYAPQYAGWCAMALTRGELLDPDPRYWLISEGKLYVFGKPFGPETFRKDLAGNIDKSNQHRSLIVNR
jgi:hypothetical protein